MHMLYSFVQLHQKWPLIDSVFNFQGLTGPIGPPGPGGPNGEKVRLIFLLVYTIHPEIYTGDMYLLLCFVDRVNPVLLVLLELLVPVVLL